MQQLKVLSLDWDFFVKATLIERIQIFPDGTNENFPSFLQDVIWVQRYADHHTEKQLKDIEVDRELFNKTLSYLTDCMFSFPEVSICESHSGAYRAIVDRMENGNYSGVNLVNLDFHHDFYENGEHVDCGNWVRKLFNRYGANKNYSWVSHSDSDPTDSLNADEDWYNQLSFKDFLSLEPKWDIIFICRSGMWSPPHLDKQFLTLCKRVLPTDMHENLKSLLPNRYTKTFKAQVKSQQNQIQEILKDMNKG